MDRKILIIAVAAVLIVAAAAIAVVAASGGGNNDKPDQPTIDNSEFDEESGVLLIYGNANKDGLMDSADASAIEVLIASKSYAKVADANQDGVIDSSDLSIVNKMINHQKTDIYYQDMTDGPTKIGYPVTSFMGIHQFVLIPMVAIGGLQYMDGYTLHPNGQSAATMLEYLYETEVNVNTSYNMVDVEKLSNLSTKPKVILTYSSSLSNENKIEKSGIQVVHLQFGIFKGSMSAVRTFGFILNLADAANEYVQFIEDVVKDIDAKIISKLGSDSDRKSVMCGYMTNCIDHSNGSYVPMAIAAGARSAFDGTDMDNNYIEFNRGDEWITAYNEDYFFYMNSWGYTDHVDQVEFYKKSADYFTTLRSYNAGNFVV
ncbi:MAG: ABC transporter substrate-binding protein, partial [Candidatus Methanomethylophilaceae archaeon]|nr:ABC transporter substrate-binding protein [Candidatus Methanomethylophilaceae archaeon]